jgi:polar amino acid transport system substrate-binding protein
MWVQKLWDIDEAFISAPGTRAIDSYEEGNKLSTVGVVTGSTGHAELTKRQFTNLRTYPNAVALTEALAKREVAAVYTADIEVKYAWRI